MTWEAVTQDFEDVELGLPDGPLDQDEQKDCFTTKIGGKPCWLRPCPETERSLTCSRCRAPLYLLLQMDCPLEEAHQVDRIIYVFACNSRECTESGQEGVVRIIVQCQRTAPKEPTAMTPPKPEGLWDKLMNFEDITEKVQHVSLSDSKPLGFLSLEYPVAFPATALHIVDELIAVHARAQPSTKLDEGMMATEEGEAWQGEAYEKTIVAGYDKTFKAFHTRVAHYPRQCVRYRPKGSPLLFSSHPLPPLPPCPACGREPAFDLQLMPAILCKLSKDSDAYLKHLPKSKRNKHPLYADGMEWGTIMVYTCGTCQLDTRQFCQFEGFPIVQIEEE